MTTWSTREDQTSWKDCRCKWVSNVLWWKIYKNINGWESEWTRKPMVNRNLIIQTSFTGAWFKCICKEDNFEKQTFMTISYPHVGSQILHRYIPKSCTNYISNTSLFKLLSTLGNRYCLLSVGGCQNIFLCCKRGHSFASCSYLFVLQVSLAVLLLQSQQFLL